MSQNNRQNPQAPQQIPPKTAIIILVVALIADMVAFYFFTNLLCIIIGVFIALGIMSQVMNMKLQQHEDEKKNQ